MKRSQTARSHARKTKRKMEAAAPATTDSSPVILFVAGARGKMTGENDATGVVTRPTAQRAQLSRHGTVVGPVRSLNGKRLSGGAGASMSCLVAIHKALADARRAHPGRRIFLATQSAGGRMAMHLFAGLWQTKPKKDGTCERFPLGAIPPKFCIFRCYQKVKSLWLLQVL